VLAISLGTVTVSYTHLDVYKRQASPAGRTNASGPYVDRIVLSSSACWADALTSSGLRNMASVIGIR